jgi:hypothetical protein
MHSIRLPASFFVLALIALTAPAFWRGYIGRPFAQVDRYTHAHAALGLAWMLLLAQILLIRSGRRNSPGPPRDEPCSALKQAPRDAGASAA